MTVGLMHQGRDTALMRKLGPNARANLDAMVDRLGKQYHKAGNGEAKVAIDAAHKKLTKELWPLLTGEAAIPGNAMAAQWNQTYRNIKMMGQLGGAVLSGASDISAYASTMRYYGDRTQGSFFSGMGEALNHTLGSIGTKVTPEQMELASELGVLLDSMASPAAMFTADATVAGRTSSWVNTFFKANGLSWWQDRIRLGASMATSSRHAAQIGKTFDELPSGMQAAFRQFNISSTEWDLIRSGGLFKDGDGRAFLTPDTIADLEPEAFHGLLQAQKIKPTKAAVERIRTEIADKYRAFFTEVSSMASSEPGVVERSIMLRGTQAGTLEGEALRHFGMYKSFMVSVMRKHLGRELFGYSAENMSIAQAMKRIVTGDNPQGLKGLANMVVFGTMLGYASMAAKDIAKGRTPRVPTDTASFNKIFLAAAAQSGSFGIYGDFLFGEAKSRFGHSRLETMMGPAVSDAATVLELYDRARSGDDFAGKGLGFLLNNAPVENGAYSLFYTRWAIDYLIVYRMQEMMNPGYLGRMERKLKSEKQQEYLVPPSSVVGYGGR
jgi:hypothetical protein